MKATRRNKLRKLGYRVTSAQEFLGLSDEEMALIDLKLSLIEKLKAVRQMQKITQSQLARMMRSSQFRVAMLEAATPTSHST